MRKCSTKWCSHTSHSFPGTLHIKGLNNTKAVIPHIEPSQGLEVVGVVQTLSGSSLPAAKALKEKAQKWISALQSGYLP